MKVFYGALGLSGFKEICYKLPPEKIVAYCQSKSKRQHFLGILQDIVSLNIVYSLKDIPVFYDNKLLQKIEIQIIEVEIERASNYKPVIDAIEACVPYDTVLVFRSKDKYLAHYISKTIIDGRNDRFYHLDTDWIYEEELEQLLFEGDWGYSIKEVKEFDDILRNLTTLQSFVGTSGEICMRRLIDMLIIREHKWDAAYIMKMLSAMYNDDEISFIGDSLFVTESKSVSYYELMSESPMGRVLVDSRYSANQRYITEGISREEMDALWNEFLKLENSRPWMKNIKEDDYNHYGYEE